MKSKATDKFWKCYGALPEAIKKKAKDTYSLFKKDPYYPSLHFKRVHSTLPIFSVRITKVYRALGVLKEKAIVWFWVGSHSDYDKFLKQMKST